MLRELAAERLREALSYNPETGVFSWLAPTNRRIRIGAPAGRLSDQGYIKIKIDGFEYKAHRLAFLYMTGKFPDLEVDHKDIDRSNNRWSNLREATASQNHANSRRGSCNTSGYKGVSWHRRTRKWAAKIEVDGRNIYLGLFSSPEDAHAAYAAAAVSHFGEFANDGLADWKRKAA